MKETTAVPDPPFASVSAAQIPGRREVAVLDGQRPAGDVSARVSPARSRNTELWLVLAAVAVTAMFAASVDLAAVGRVTPSVAVLPGGLGAVCLVAHVALRWLAPRSDALLVPCATMINGVSVVFLHRLDLARAQPAARATYPALAGLGGRQLAWIAVSVVCFVAVLWAIRDHRVASRYPYTFGLVGVVLVVIPVLLPARYSEVYGSKLWIRFGGFSIQPGEFAKLTLMIFFAYYLVRKREVLTLASRRVLGVHLPRGRDLGPVVTVWLASMLVLATQKDLGMALLYFGTFVAGLYIATSRASWVILGLLLFCVGSVATYLVYPRLQVRVAIWLDPFADPNGSGYQLLQGLLGMGTGGLFGTGPGAGNPTLVPEVHNDFIIAGLGEETGLAGLTALLVVYLVIVERGLRTAITTRDPFGKILAGGLAFSLGLQVFVIVAGVTALIPLTGQTTPLLSAGGSSLVANWILIALLLRISDNAHQSRQPPPALPRISQEKTVIVGTNKS